MEKKSSTPKYRIYATLLDAYSAYLNSDKTWERIWGWSEKPSYTPEEFKAKQYQELIDRINRVPLDSEAADRGTALNDLIDTLIHAADYPNIVRVIDSNGNAFAYEVRIGQRMFTFSVNLAQSIADKYADALAQVKVSSILPTTAGDIELYGYVDYLMPFSLHDLKTTSNYYMGKYRDNWQHIVYPYCLCADGQEICEFDYDIVEFSTYKDTIFNEHYRYIPEVHIPLLKDHCVAFAAFLEENKNLITDKKIFNGEAC